MERMSGEGTQTQSREPEGATANAGKAWSLEGPEPKSRRAEDPKEPQVEL
jgi:hypothetical protein